MQVAQVIQEEVQELLRAEEEARMNVSFIVNDHM